MESKQITIFHPMKNQAYTTKHAVKKTSVPAADLPNQG